MRTIILFITTGLMMLSGCSGCSKSGRIKKGDSEGVAKKEGGGSRKYPDKTIVKMVKEDDVYKIPVTVDGVGMVFIFDTGAGLISISNVEASYLYKQGKLTNDDILGEEKFSDANGDISVGTIVNLKEITIGNRTIYNIHASVVNNSIAPLLFGQSALEKFGKIYIDYEQGTITFE
jgi:aspartyl protease family protein